MQSCNQVWELPFAPVRAEVDGPFQRLREDRRHRPGSPVDRGSRTLSSVAGPSVELHPGAGRADVSLFEELGVREDDFGAIDVGVSFARRQHGAQGGARGVARPLGERRYAESRRQVVDEPHQRGVDRDPLAQPPRLALRFRLAGDVDPRLALGRRTGGRPGSRARRGIETLRPPEDGHTEGDQGV